MHFDHIKTFLLVLANNNSLPMLGMDDDGPAAEAWLAVRHEWLYLTGNPPLSPSFFSGRWGPAPLAPCFLQA